MTSRTIPPIFGKQLEFKYFSHVLYNGPHLKRYLQRRYGKRLSHVVPGCESGVELSDRLSEELRLPSNGTALTRARRDKFLMAETVRKYGLRTADVFRFDDLHELKHWADSMTSWPVVIKPVSSVASDNVRLCESEKDVVVAGEQIIGKKNALGIVNKSVLAQEYLNGQEYVVDTVSLDGHHKITAFWAYRKRRARRKFMGYDAMTLMPYDGELQKSLARYTVNVLNALQVRFGPAHCEIMWCEREPILVEIGARLSAGLNVVLSKACGCISQLDETIKAILTPDEFHDFSKDKLILKKHASNVFFLREKPGRLRRIRHKKALGQLETLYHISISARKGEWLPPVLGMVTLVHERQNVIERDIDKIGALENEGLFEIDGD
jgi:biotin carboxylase